jgi:DNA excision repair protein ERCC-3
LKEDHEKRPIWVSDDSECPIVFLEAFNPLYEIATEFLVAIAEPISRPSFIHEYKLTKFSLYAASSVGLSDDVIIRVLEKFSKNEKIPISVKEFIGMHSESYGKAKLVLRKNQHFVEACDMATMNKLQSFECIK